MVLFELFKSIVYFRVNIKLEKSTYIYRTVTRFKWVLAKCRHVFESNTPVIFSATSASICEDPRPRGKKNRPRFHLCMQKQEIRFRLGSHTADQHLMLPNKHIVGRAHQMSNLTLILYGRMSSTRRR